MTSAFIHGTVIAYTVSCVLYIAQLSRTPPSWSRWAGSLLGLGIVFHVAWIVVVALEGRSPFEGTQQALATFSVGLALTYLAVAKRYRLTGVGAFVIPVTLFMLLSAHFAQSEALSPGVRSILLVIHVSANLVGQIAFGLAFAISIVYLILERRLKRKKHLVLGVRGPSLDQLDRIGFRCVSIGFPLLTLGIVLGAVFSRRIGEQPFRSSEQIMAVLMWLLFAGVLALRASIGWRGRRAAIGTVMGFLMGVGVLLVYLLRSGPPAGGQ